MERHDGSFKRLCFRLRPGRQSIPMAIPVTIFTGFLGAGKTSIILSLLPQLPKEHRVVLLKNEFGEIEGWHFLIALLGSRLIPSPQKVDSQLAKQSNLAAVSEILNGCM